MIRLYLAAPYTSDPEPNVLRAIDMAEEFTKLGVTVYLPILSHYWEIRHPHSWEHWMEHDFEWLQLCHVMFRMPGESKGCDLEEEEARRLGIPTFRTKVGLETWLFQKGILSMPAR